MQIHALLVFLLLCACGGSPRDPSSPGITPVTPSDTVPAGYYAFNFTPPSGAPGISSLSVPGTFNDWSTTATPMTRRADGSWRALVPTGGGPVEYKFYINGAWVNDMCRDLTWGNSSRSYIVDGGALGCITDGFSGQNAVTDLSPVVGSGASIGFAHEPNNPAQLSAAGGRLSIRFRVKEAQVTGATLKSGGLAVPMHRQANYRLQDLWRGTIPEGSAAYSITVQTSSGSQDFGPFTVPGAVFRAVPWVGSSVGYQIFPERFSNGDPSNDSLAVKSDEYRYMDAALRGAPPFLMSWNGAVTSQLCCHAYAGGDLQGVIDHLDHLQSLGVSLLYLNPIWSSGSAHGYDTWDYLAVEPSFGDEGVLRRLLTQAKARGIRIIWDFVPNHVGIGHGAFQDAVQKGSSSPTWNWFTFKVPAGQIQVGNGNHYEGWFGLGGLPKLNTGSSAVREHLMSAVRKWTTFGFSGIRVDVPNELQDRVNFLRTFRQTAKEIDPEQYLVGEIWQRKPEYVQGDQFDALMNYAIGLDVIEKFAHGDMGGDVARNAMAQLYAEYPEASAAMQFNVIATHDNSRLLTQLGGGALGATPSADALARQRLASAMLYALPGVPVTFQGDECAFLGASGNNRDEHRYPMQWGACDQQMVAHYRELARIKGENPALSSPALRLYHGTGTLLGWYRGEPGTGEVLALFNAGSTTASVPLPSGNWTDLSAGGSISTNAAVAARGWRYLRRE